MSNPDVIRQMLESNPQKQEVDCKLILSFAYAFLKSKKGNPTDRAINLHSR